MTMADSDIEDISSWGGGYLEKNDKERTCCEKRQNTKTTNNVASDYLAIQNMFMRESIYLQQKQHFSFSLVYPIPYSANMKGLASDIRHVDSRAEVLYTADANINLSTIRVCANIETAVKVMDHVLKFVRNICSRDPYSVTVARKEKRWFLSNISSLFEKYALVPHVHSENENFTLYTLVKDEGPKLNNLLNCQQQIQQLQQQLFQIQQYQKQQQGQQFQEYNNQLYNGSFTPLPNTNAYTYAAAVQQQQQANRLLSPFGHQHAFLSLPFSPYKGLGLGSSLPPATSVTTPGGSASAVVATPDYQTPHAYPPLYETNSKNSSEHHSKRRI